ncbi:hypothetical protein [Mechercharimyces sp. CAU 1602]|uniref:hypothetical protein n=1 Tax=Mechercharimyces sp. CAU 1602 TaxID=2973933 RepID=UPI00216167A6|nr:hypothetical protein [Mechercharimyces sp. CAU 1602]
MAGVTTYGPAILMTKGDHAKTSSFRNIPGAKAYRARQAELIRQGNFKQAQQMDIDDIRSKFGDKYDEGIEQMVKYSREKGYY